MELPRESYHSYCYSGDYPTRVSALNCTAKPKSPVVWACLGVDPLDMPRAPYRENALSITHHAPSPHPHIIICTSFISLIDYNVCIVLQCHLKDHFYRITMSLKIPFVPKSDVKHWFTTVLLLLDIENRKIRKNQIKLICPNIITMVMVLSADILWLKCVCVLSSWININIIYISLPSKCRIFTMFTPLAKK